MTLKNKLLKLSRILFFVLILLVPLNLGKHFELIDSYVWGILIDYLVPTVYLQDIILFFVILFWVLSGGLKRFFSNSNKVLERKEVQFSILFVFSVFLSVLNSVRFIPSLYAYSRLVLYFFLFIYILLEIPVEDYFFKILRIFSFSIFLLSVLGIAQYLSGGSVFDNYLILGEQPYSASTFDVAKKSFLGRSVIPSYGLFRHPNVFGGYLSILLVWIATFVKKRKQFLAVFVLGTISLFFTFSIISWGVFIFGLLLHLFFQKDPVNIIIKKRFTMWLVFLTAFLILIMPLVRLFENSEDPSVFRRMNFARASYRMITDYPLFGVGWNNSTALMDEYNYETRDVRFVQPVHNIFLLVFSESGIFSFGLFIVFLYFSGRRLINSRYFHLFLISFLQIILLGSFDHYFLTINQTLLLFWIIFGLALQ
jgi:hypothetical protein